MRVEGGRVLVVGLGRSGRATVEFLVGLRDGGTPLEIHAVDGMDDEALRDEASKWRARGVDVRLAAPDALGEWDLVVASPGVPPRNALLLSATRGGAPVTSEIELAWAHSDVPFVAVTGTNGKTTTTMLIAHLLRCAGVAAEAVGNIDPPAIALAPQAAADSVMVCEVSSFQLAHIHDFHPRVSVLLNVTPDHIDWHGSLERYTSDKARVFENLSSSDLGVVVVDDAGAAPFANELEARGLRVCRVSLDRMHEGGASVAGGMLTLSTLEGVQGLLGVADLRIRGAHNIRNALAASAAAFELGADRPSITKGLKTFAPVEHRLEPAGMVCEVEYVNDSKATNPEATLAALEAFSGTPVVLLLGGYLSPEASFRALRPALDGVRSVVAFGAATDRVLRDLEDAVSTSRAQGLASAVAVASDLAHPGDVVLLSPACKSFDEFTDFEQRGRAFKTLVERMAGERVEDGR